MKTGFPLRAGFVTLRTVRTVQSQVDLQALALTLQPNQIVTSFAIAIFFGAFLLFSVQPMMGKFVLPWFGGGTAVWSTCMLFFQIVLLAGYAYAHWSARHLRPRTQALTHLALIGIALCFLPVIPNVRWQPAASADPTLSILWLLAATVGLPYFILSATGPLMQHWFSLARPGVSPYRLFALSNAGSLLALASYPFLLEPLFARKTQALIWSFGMGFFAVSAATCAAMLWRAHPAPAANAASPPADEPSPSFGTKLLWLALSACASALMLAFTNKICLDVVVMPFLWVLPLAIYLLSFIVSFAGLYKRWLHGSTLALPVLLVWYVLSSQSEELAFLLPVYAVALFYCCLVCHGELYQLRPSPRRLTSFYLMIATGGALGGIFVAVIAPLIFNDYYELQWGLIFVLILMTAILWREGGKLVVRGRTYPLWQAAAAVCVLIALLFYRQINSTIRTSTEERIQTVRNFYGVLKLTKMLAPGSPYVARGLSCGTTLHGFQVLPPGPQDVPTAYYHQRTGIGLLWNALPSEPARRVGVVGLGTGTLAAYGRTNDVIRFYEINPMDIKLASEQFTFLSRSQARTEIVPGDARLSLERESPQQLDLLVLDAFNSDAIPVHLLTREAFQIYDRHLKRDGVIAVHISSKHVNLAPVLAGLATEFKMAYAEVDWSPFTESNRLGAAPVQPWETFDCKWFLISRNKELISRPEITERSAPLPQRGHSPIWTDDHTSLLPLVIWN